MDHTLRLRVASAADIAARIRMLELVAESGELPPFDAGSHIEFRTGNGLLRCYSLANDPAERHRYVIAVLREGDGSGWMHGVAPGAVVEGSVPRNGFALSETASFHLLLAGGIGITPLRAMAYRLRAIGASFRLVGLDPTVVSPGAIWEVRTWATPAVFTSQRSIECSAMDLENP